MAQFRKGGRADVLTKGAVGVGFCIVYRPVFRWTLGAFSWGSSTNATCGWGAAQQANSVQPDCVFAGAAAYGDHPISNSVLPPLSVVIRYCGACRARVLGRRHVHRACYPCTGGVMVGIAICFQLIRCAGGIMGAGPRRQLSAGILYTYC